MTIIAFTGIKRSGKDISGQYLVSKYEFQRAAFADALKKITNYIFPFIDLSDEGKEKYVNVPVYDKNLTTAFKMLGIATSEQPKFRNIFLDVFRLHILYFNDNSTTFKISPRRAYQLMGSEFVRNNLDDEYWLKAIDLSVPNLVMTDLRFPNEAEFIKSNGGIIIEIRNPRLEWNDSHASEAGIDKELVDYVVVNDEDLETLYNRLDFVMEEIGN